MPSRVRRNRPGSRRARFTWMRPRTRRRPTAGGLRRYVAHKRRRANRVHRPINTHYTKHSEQPLENKTLLLLHRMGHNIGQSVKGSDRLGPSLFMKGLDYSILLENARQSVCVYANIAVIQEKIWQFDDAGNPPPTLGSGFFKGTTEPNGMDFSSSHFAGQNQFFRATTPINSRRFKTLMRKRIKLMPQNPHPIQEGTTEATAGTMVSTGASYAINTTTDATQEYHTGSSNPTGNDKKLIKGYLKINKKFTYRSTASTRPNQKIFVVLWADPVNPSAQQSTVKYTAMFYERFNP